MELCHGKTARVFQIVDSIKVLILVLFCAQIQYRTSPKTVWKYIQVR